MASNTKNVKLGVCNVFFDGVDLGYTKGGVEVSVSTETHKVQVDQFGKTTVNEYVMSRNLVARVPLAETTLQNLAAIMPGATLTLSGGKAATGYITIVTNPAANETIVVNGATVTFKSTLTGAANEVLIGATIAATVANLVEALNASTTPDIAEAYYFAGSSVAGGAINRVNIRYGNELIYGNRGDRSVAGNDFTLAVGTAGVKVTVSGATLTGGADNTKASIDVPTGVGIDLLTYARELRFRPVDKTEADKSEDFIVPLAATAGALNFAYKLEEERVYNCEFNGYPDPYTKLLFAIGE